MEGGAVKMIDQRLLPHEFRITVLLTYDAREVGSLAQVYSLGKYRVRNSRGVRI